jgi:glyoxylase-like metal-dependent hydrolase (beta-lactamase superfamily II)
MTPEAGARAWPDSIHVLQLPTPFAVGSVNSYLIEDDPLTLVDAGPNLGSALDVLESGLSERGFRVEDLGLLLVTHPHPDHSGLIGILAARSGASVACLDAGAPFLEEYDARSLERDEGAAMLMRRHGVEAAIVSATESASAVGRAWGASAPIDRRLMDREVLILRGRAIRVLHRPGHSPWDTLFVDETARIAFAGDHVIEHTSSNALVSCPPGDSRICNRSRPLIDYRRSLQATWELDLDFVLPGHGAPITAHRALIERRLRQHEQRANALLELLDQPRTAHELARLMWNGRAISEPFLSLSEVLGHLDLLIEDGLVIEDAIDSVVRFGRA